MASNIVAKFADIKGESVQEGFVEWIEAGSLSFGANAPVNVSGQGLGSGKGTPTGYNLTTEMGTHSALLLKKMLEGTHHTTFDIRCLKLANAPAPVPYFTVDGKKAYVANLGWSAGPDGKLYENISVEVEEHTWEYHKQETEGGALSAQGKNTYNVQSGTTS